MRNHPSRRHVWPVLCGLSLTVLGACAGDAAKSTGAPSVTVQSSDLVAAGRVATASSAPDCARLDATAGSLRSAVANLPAVAALTAAIKDASADIGPFDGLLLGEVHRSRDAFASDGTIDQTELVLLSADLSNHLAGGGVGATKRAALRDALSLRGSAIAPATRRAAADLVVLVADVLADVQACSPKP